jgi:hypothetical protein
MRIRANFGCVPFDSPAICLKTSIFIVFKVSHGKADQVFFLRATLEPPLDVPLELFKSYSISLRFAKLEEFVLADERLDSFAEPSVQPKRSRHASCPLLSASY